MDVYALYPRLLRRPRARSNLRPLERTRARVWLCGTPGASPKYRSAVLAFLGPGMKDYVGNTAPLHQNIKQAISRTSSLSRNRKPCRRNLPG